MPPSRSGSVGKSARIAAAPYMVENITFNQTSSSGSTNPAASTPGSSNFQLVDSFSDPMSQDGLDPTAAAGGCGPPSARRCGSPSAPPGPRCAGCGGSRSDLPRKPSCAARPSGDLPKKVEILAVHGFQDLTPLGRPPRPWRSCRRAASVTGSR